MNKAARNLNIVLTKLPFQIKTFAALLVAGVWSRESFGNDPLVFENRKLIGVQEQGASMDITLGVFLHVHFEEFIDDFAARLQEFPARSEFFMTATSGVAAKKLKAVLESEQRPWEIRVVPNRGRNFGPLLVEYGKKMTEFEFILHLHSKKSSHAGKILNTEWADLIFQRLMSATYLRGALSFMVENPKVGLIYRDLAGRFRKVNSYWGANRGPLTQSDFYKSSKAHLNWKLPVAYPIGGMFLARTQSLRQLLEFEWKYEMFPEEKGQLDGTLQHSVERYVGFLATFNNFEHGVFSGSPDTFITFSNSNSVKA